MSCKQNILEQLCYTELVYNRINKKLGLNYSKPQTEELIMDCLKECDDSDFSKTGKNYYAYNRERNIRVTINSYTYRVITVDKITRS